MKKQITMILLILFGGLCSQGQSLSADFLVIDNSCRSAEQLKTQFNGENTIVVFHTKVLAFDQITSALQGRQVADLHIYVSTKPGALGFCNMTLNSESFQEHATVLSKLASHITGKIVIHSTDVFTTDKGLEFKTQLEQITGLDFVMQ